MREITIALENNTGAVHYTLQHHRDRGYVTLYREQYAPDGLTHSSTTTYARPGTPTAGGYAVIVVAADVLFFTAETALARLLLDDTLSGLRVTSSHDVTFRAGEEVSAS
jgi:hypothetical protein